MQYGLRVQTIPNDPLIPDSAMLCIGVRDREEADSKIASSNRVGVRVPLRAQKGLFQVV
jgi:hypothetical protein